jgi:hypothetical protein
MADLKGLEKKTVAQLKEMAKELGITGLSSMKKADLVKAVAEAAPAPEEETVTKPVAEVAPEPEAEAAPEPEAEAAPEPEAEAPPEPEAEAAPEPEAEAAPEPEAEAPPEPAPEPTPAREKPPTKLQIRLREKYDLDSLKTEKRALKGQIAEAVAAKEKARVKDLRKRKKELRRILNKAS